MNGVKSYPAPKGGGGDIVQYGTVDKRECSDTMIVKCLNAHLRFKPTAVRKSHPCRNTLIVGVLCKATPVDNFCCI
jgi:hypothetical protein